MFVFFIIAFRAADYQRIFREKMRIADLPRENIVKFSGKIKKMLLEWGF